MEIEHDSYLESGYFRGFPRDKEKLLNLTELNLLGFQLISLPVEIGKLTNIKKLYLLGHQITEMPKEIGNLVNLTEFDCLYNKIALSKADVEWLEKPMNKDCDVCI